MIELVELFSGVGAFSKALENLELPHKTIAMCEIDKHAIKAYNALHGETPNLGDISNVEHLPKCNLLTYSFPCQDLSLAGHMNGMSRDSNTRSGLLWQVERLLLDAHLRQILEPNEQHLPQYLIMENVDAIVNQLNIRDFNQWVRSLTKMGYTSSHTVMDAMDYGVPQKRMRCFMVSSLGHDRLRFPPPCPDGRVLKDILEDNASKKHYLSDRAVRTLSPRKYIQDNGIMVVGDVSKEIDALDMWRRVYSADGIAPTLSCKPGIKILDDTNSIPIRESDNSISRAQAYDHIKTSNTGGRGTNVQKGYALTILDSSRNAVVTDDLKIRRLTSRESWRLQGFSDADYDTVRNAGVSDSQMYKLAGNSIAVPCIEAIFRSMYIDKSWITSPTLDYFN